jgi:hypothetical protein
MLAHAPQAALHGATEWINTRPLTATRLSGKVAAASTTHAPLAAIRHGRGRPRISG